MPLLPFGVHPGHAGRRLALWATLAAVVLAGLPAAASAQLIFDHGKDLYAAADDGSHPHLLVSAASLGMDLGLGSPGVAPAGKVLLFRGSTARNRHPGHGRAVFGENADGVYSLSKGKVVRLSGRPSGSAVLHTTSDLMPEPAPGGRYVYERRYCAAQEFALTWVPFCTSRLNVAPLAKGASAARRFASACDHVPSDVADPAPDPAGGALRIAYAGCSTHPSDVLTDAREALIVSGPGHHGQVVIGLGADSSGVDDPAHGFADPSWSPDGSHVVAFADGGIHQAFVDLSFVDTPVAGGLYVYDDLTQTTPGRLVLGAPRGADGHTVPLHSPRYAGLGTIVFAAQGSVWSVPSDCSGCTFPADARKLHDGGRKASTQASGVAWTSRTVRPAKARRRPHHRHHS